MPTFISNLPIAKRLGAGFVLVLIMSTISIVIGLARLSSVAQVQLIRVFLLRQYPSIQNYHA
ncbi:hypothetical protein PQQ86_23190 [Paraburkholderia sediminicola]|uniref:hypothetical protein n=1 Tax=Paraburkholderia sediminicola TaxID=458836 RepID=UPI0038B7C5CD